MEGSLTAKTAKKIRKGREENLKAQRAQRKSVETAEDKLCFGRSLGLCVSVVNCL